MARSKKPSNQPEKPPKGIRRRVLGDGREVFDPLVKIKGKQKSLGTCDSLDEAIAMRHAYFQKLSKEGEHVPRDIGVLTVAQLGELCPMNEWDVDRWRARVLEMAEFARWPATQVLPEHVQIWIDNMANTPIKVGRSAGELPTRGTLESAISLLRRVYRWARMPSRRYVTHNPAEGVTIGNSTDAKPKSKRNLLEYLWENEAKILLEASDAAIPLEPKTKFVVLMMSGARPSDVWRLRWERIDWSAESIRFTSAKTSKVEAHDYTVHALPQLMAALRKWHFSKGRPATGLVFPSIDEDGNETIYPRGYDAGWADKLERRHRVWFVDDTEDGSLSADSTRPKQATRTGAEAKELRKQHGERRTSKGKLKVTPGWRSKLGIKREVPLYALRHTCACQLLLGSQLFTGGRQWSREEIQSQLGHRDSKATEHYMRALGILGRRAALESKAALQRVKKP